MNQELHVATNRMIDSSLACQRSTKFRNYGKNEEIEIPIQNISQNWWKGRQRLPKNTLLSAK